MTRTLTVEGTVTAAVDALAALTTQGSETAPSRQIPSGKSKVTRIIAALAGDGSIDAGTAIFIRLSGNAFPGGPHIIPIGGNGGEITASADQTANFHIAIIDVDIDVKAGNVATVSAEYGGVDIGSPEVGITLYFD